MNGIIFETKEVEIIKQKKVDVYINSNHPLFNIFSECAIKLAEEVRKICIKSEDELCLFVDTIYFPEIKIHGVNIKIKNKEND